MRSVDNDDIIGWIQQAKTEMVGSKKIKFQIWDTAGQEKYATHTLLLVL